MLRMMLRPRWLLALLVVLLLAGGFAALAQWQVSRAFNEVSGARLATEQVRPFAGIAQPDAATLQSATGQLVAATGRWVPEDGAIVTERRNGSAVGVWLVEHFEVTDGPPGGLPIAIGWAPDAATADAARARFATTTDPSLTTTVVGRFLPSDPPEAQSGGGSPDAMPYLSVAQLVNLWANYDGKPAYFAYLTARTPLAGLAAIDSPPPAERVELNWLNVFYAAEWIIFAGFALFLWSRLVHDALERERETASDKAPPQTQPPAQDPTQPSA